MTRLLSACILFLLHTALWAQEDEGFLQFVGHNLFNNKPLTNTEVRVLSGGVTYTTTNTGNSKDFKLILPFGAQYDLYFYNQRTQTMFLRVLAQEVPKAKYNMKTTYDLSIPFFPRDSKNLDTLQFKQPFHRIYFEKNHFTDDTAYMHKFLAKVYVQEKPDTVVTPPVAVTQPQTGTLVGKVVYDTKDKTPLKDRTVVLEDKEGHELASTKTTQHGTFVFQNARIDNAFRVRVKFNDADAPTGQKIIIQNSNGEAIDSAPVNAATKDAQVENTPKNELIKKLVDNVFTYKIAGKLTTNDGTNNKVVADKYVYLLSDRNNVIQKVKTNALGVFLFTNIKPNQQYSIAVDEKDCEMGPNSKLVLYNTGNKRLRIIDSLSKNRFVYKFLSVSNQEFNDLLIDDIDLKMNVKGRIYGDNTNNPIGDMKVMLMNEKYEVIDTTITEKDGSFSFKYQPYMRQLIISSDDQESMLEAFNNIMVFDNDQNLIKIVSLVKGMKFVYKPLKGEQSKLTELFVDDPWLSVMDKDYSSKKGLKTEVIIENIQFDFNKSEILPQAKQSLDKVVLAMNLNPALTIILGAHTDSKGGDAYNLKLSESRASSAKQYLVEKGIAENRIKAIGYGETKLLNHCDNKTVCPEEEHAANRRLEFTLDFHH